MVIARGGAPRSRVLILIEFLGKGEGMRKLFGRRPSPAFVIAVIALFVALGGGAYAITLGKNAVKTKNIASGAVKTKKIANSAVTNGKLANAAVTTPKLANSAVTPAKAQVAFAKVSAAGAKSNDEKVNSVSDSRLDLLLRPRVHAEGGGGERQRQRQHRASMSVLEVPGNSTCPAGQQDASVVTNGGATPYGFFVVFY